MLRLFGCFQGRPWPSRRREHGCAHGAHLGNSAGAGELPLYFAMALKWQHATDVRMELRALSALRFEGHQVLGVSLGVVLGWARWVVGYAIR